MRYDSNVELAERLLSRNGAPVVLRGARGTLADSAKPWRVNEGTAAEQRSFAVLITGNLTTSGSQREKGHATVSSEVTAFVSARTLLEDPLPGDTLEDATGKSWTVKQVKPLAPNGQRILFQLELST